MSDFLKFLSTNRKSNDYILATVTTVIPLTVKILPTDTAFNVVATTGLLGLKVGSRVVLLKFLDQFIAIAALGRPSYQLLQLDDAVNLTDTTLVDTDLEFDFEAGCKYHVFLSLGASGHDDNGIKLDWNNTGTIPASQIRRTNGQAFGQADRTDTTTCMRQSFLTTDIEYGCDNYNTIMEWYILETTTAGTMTLRAAKYANPETGTDTVISATSYIIVTKIA